MVFVFDLDDTVCDTDSYSEEYISNYFTQNSLPYKQIAKDTRYAEQKFDWDRETALNWYKKHGDDMMLNFPCKSDAKEIMLQLKDMGHTIIIATARADDWHTKPKEVTEMWLKNNGINYDKLYVGRVDKELICEQEKADFFVDDDLKITAKVAQHNKERGMKVCLMTTNYNRDLDIAQGVDRINNFYDIIKLIGKNL